MKYIVSITLLSLIFLTSCFEKPVSEDIENNTWAVTEDIIEGTSEQDEVTNEDEVEESREDEESQTNDIDEEIQESEGEQDSENISETATDPTIKSESSVDVNSDQDDISEEELNETSNELEELFRDIGILGEDAE